MQSDEVLQSLSNIKDQVETHLRNVKEYRAFLAIQTAIDEISHVNELVSPLEGVKDGVRQRLNDLREYRAMLAVEKSITDIGGVLGLLDEIAPRPAPEASTTVPPAADAIAAEVKEQAQPATAPTAAGPEAAAVSAPAEIIVATSPIEAVPPAPAEIVPAPLPAEAYEVVLPAKTTAGTAPTEFATAPAMVQGTVTLPAAVATDAPVTVTLPPPAVATDAPPEPMPTAVGQDLDSLRLALGAPPAAATEPPFVPPPAPERMLAAASPAPVIPPPPSELLPANEPSGIFQGQAQAEPPAPAPDTEVAKVA